MPPNATPPPDQMALATIGVEPPSNPRSLHSAYPMGMDIDFDFPEVCDAAEALKLRRTAMRQFVAEITAAVMCIPMPETYLEADHAARAVTVADRVNQRLADLEDKPVPTSLAELKKQAEDGPPVENVRKGLRLYADRLMKAAALIPLPQTFLEGARAARFAQSCDLLLTQLYSAPKPNTDFGEYEEAVDAWVFKPRSKGVHPEDVRHVWADWQFKLEDKLVAQSNRRLQRARESGFNHDGTPYVPEPVIETYGPHRYNPDGSILCTYESLKHDLALSKAARDAANAAHEWSEPPKPDDPP